MEDASDNVNTCMQKKLKHSDDGRGPARVACNGVCVDGGVSSGSSSRAGPPAKTYPAAALTDVVDHDGVDVDSMMLFI